MVFDNVLGLGEHREWAVGSPRAPANLPEWSWNDLEQNICLVSRSIKIFDFDFLFDLLCYF